MEYFIYCRDNPDTGAILDELAEAHWSFMDGYADAMIARGPTLTPDRMRHTGGMHIVDLPDGDAARVRLRGAVLQGGHVRAGAHPSVEQ
jgi:uncharacterized protein